MRRLLFTSIAFVLVLIPHVGHTAFPRPSGFVNDFAGVMQTSTRDKLERSLATLEQKTGVEIAVVTVKTLNERPIEDYAVDLYQHWGIGKKGTDEGALLLVAPNDRKVRIEVGYGLEGALNDAQAGRIIRDAMIPFFKQGDFTKGIVAGTQAVAAVAMKEKGYEPQDLGQTAGYVATPPAKKKGGILSAIFKVILFLIMAYLFIRHPWLFLFFLASGGGRVGGGGRSSGFSGGFGGFGGGMSGGGGASGSW